MLPKPTHNQMIGRIPSCYRSLAIGLLSLAVLSCEEVFDPTMLGSSPKLVVISQFSPGEPVEVRVARTRSVVEPQADYYIFDAQVEIWEDSIELAQLALHRKVGPEIPFYSTPDFIPEEGVLYTIHVEAPNFPPVSATSFVPERIALLETQVEDLEVDSIAGLYNFNLRIRFEDPGLTSNFYHVNIFQEILGTGGEKELEELRKIFFSEEGNSKSRTANLDGGLLYQDADFNGSIAELSIPIRISLDPEHQILGKTLVELRTVTEEYYLFQSSISKQSGDQIDPLSEPTLLFNNIQNGHGVFAGYNSFVDSVRVIP